MIIWIYKLSSLTDLDVKFSQCLRVSGERVGATKR